jgi:hypothetical protein
LKIRKHTEQSFCQIFVFFNVIASKGGAYTADIGKQKAEEYIWATKDDVNG